MPTINTAVDAVAAQIIAGRPPVNAITQAITTDAYKPSLGSTAATTEKPIASGMSARATTIPERISSRGLRIHSRKKALCVIGFLVRKDARQGPLAKSGRR